LVAIAETEDDRGESQCRRLYDGHVVSVVEALVTIQYNVLVGRNGYTGNLLV